MKKKVMNKVTVDKDAPAEVTTLSKSSGLPLKDLQEVYTKSYEELKNKGVQENLVHLALNGVKNHIRKMTKKTEFVPKAKAIQITGFIFGDAGMWDKADQLRNEAKRYVEKNGVQAAIEENLINADNQVLDTREKVYGRENPEYLKPFPDKIKLRSHLLYMVARKNGSKDYKYGTIQTNDNQLALAWNKVKMFVPCQVFGILKEETDTDFKFNSSQAEDTMSIFKGVKEDMDIDKIFMDTVTPELTEISKVEERHEHTKDAWDRLIFVKGIVTWINRDRPSPWGSIYMGLMDEDRNEVRISIPSHLSVDFGEYSEIIAYGKTRRTKQKDENNKLVEADVVIDAVGLYPLKGLKTPADVNKPESLEEEAEIEGWVD